MKTHPFWTATTGITVAVAIGYVLWPDAAAHEAQAVSVPAFMPMGPSSLFVAPGVTEPNTRTIALTSALPGQLAAIHVRAGDRVERGQVVAEIDGKVQRISVEMARASLDRSRADLDRLESGPRREERAVAKARLDEAEADLRLAEFEAARVREMEEQQAASKREIANTERSLALAKARRDVAYSQWQLSEAGTREEDLAYARAAVREADARLATAEAILDDTLVRSPIDGIVIYRHMEPGEAVLAGGATPILSMGDCSPIHVRVDVDETDVSRVWVGQRVQATAGAFEEKRFAGRVVHVEPTLGRKNFRTQLPTERLDTRVQEVVVELEDGSGLPIELQMVVWFLNDGVTTS